MLKNILGRIRIIKYLVFIPLIAMIMTNCEREVDIDLPDPVEKLVVEGSIETGSPPFVILNRNFPYFGTISYGMYQENFVHDATVTVSDGETSITLAEICWSDLSEAEKSLFGSLAGTALPDSLGSSFDFCLYTNMPPSMLGQAGKKYALHISTPDGKEASALTSIPMPVPLDSFWLKMHNSGKAEYDSLRRLFVQLKDPDTLGNYYRYFIKINDGAMVAPTGSVYDDLVVNGSEFFFPLDRPVPAGEQPSFETFGYFTLGDTVTVKWVTIDHATYSFWNTLEFVRNSAGPFGGPTKVVYNIEGENAIGIWGGAAISNLQEIIIQ